MKIGDHIGNKKFQVSMSTNFACIWIINWFPSTSLSHTSFIPTRWGNRCKCNRKEHTVVHGVGNPTEWEKHRCALVVKKDINFNCDHSLQRWVWLYENAADVRHYQYARYYNLTPSIMGNVVLYIARISTYGTHSVGLKLKEGKWWVFDIIKFPCNSQALQLGRTVMYFHP